MEGHCRPDFKLEKEVSDKLPTFCRRNHDNPNIGFVIYMQICIKTKSYAGKQECNDPI